MMKMTGRILAIKWIQINKRTRKQHTRHVTIGEWHLGKLQGADLISCEFLQHGIASDLFARN
jgi:hypothetical protein